MRIISPWAQHGVVDDTYYSQITMVRTIEQILGAQPLNEKVAAATPMAAAFTSTPDMTPFTAVPNQVSLTESIKTAPDCGLDTTPAPTTSTSTTTTVTGSVTPQPTVAAGEQATAAAWTTWLAQQKTTGNGAVPDYANPEQMNRYTWYVTHDWKVPYPGDSKIYAPADVPGAYIPSPDSN